MVMVVAAFPVKVVQVIFPVAAPAVPAIPSVRPATGMSMAAAVSNTRRMMIPPCVVIVDVVSGHDGESRDQPTGGLDRQIHRTACS
jgi:hypothetical protein